MGMFILAVVAVLGTTQPAAVVTPSNFSGISARYSACGFQCHSSPGAASLAANISFEAYPNKATERWTRKIIHPDPCLKTDWPPLDSVVADGNATEMVRLANAYGLKAVVERTPI
eukprot:2448533-Prymnesium_polylepis.1